MADPAPRKAAGEDSALPASRGRAPSPRTTTDGFAGQSDDRSPPPQDTGKAAFNFGRHRWLGRVMRDEKLPGAALRTAVLLWELQNAEHGCAWPSLTYIAAQLKMHKSTVIRSLRMLGQRGWITTAHRGGRHRTNQYRIAFGSMDEDGKVDGFVRLTPDNQTSRARICASGMGQNLTHAFQQTASLFDYLVGAQFD
jgi:hypothetical protein